MVATHPFVRVIATVLAIVATLFGLLVSVLLLSILPAIWPLTADPTVAGFVGVLVGAFISALVSYSLQLTQFKVQSLQSKKSRIYQPLYENLLALEKALTEHPFPSYVWNEPIPADYPVEDEPSFYVWSQILKDGRQVEVPGWLAVAFTAFVSELPEYATRYAKCSEIVEKALIADLVSRGLLERASGFGDLGLILNDQFDTDIVTPFSIMNHGTLEAGERFRAQSAQLLPELFRNYSQLDCVRNLKSFYHSHLISHLKWLIRTMERVMRLIDVSYESQDQYL